MIRAARRADEGEEQGAGAKTLRCRQRSKQPWRVESWALGGWGRAPQVQHHAAVYSLERLELEAGEHLESTASVCP